jgi:nitrite reductase/ring-hydroxylating ferredoxin subunit
MPAPLWQRIGPVEQLSKQPLQQLRIGDVVIALSYRNGQFGAISGVCNHVGGPLGDGTLSDEDYVVCPWHSWHFHRLTGLARPGIPSAVPVYELKIENGELFINLTAVTERQHAPHPPHPLTREIKREPGPLRVVGISTTAMNHLFPRYSTVKKKELRQTIDTVEDKFKRCWDILATLRSRPIRSLEKLQPTLGDALFDISKAYNSIRQHRKALVNRKSSFSNSWFVHQQRLCGRMETALVEARGIGLALGNSFVWPFFRNDLELLRAHAKHPNTDDLHPGLGGLGELQFVQRAPVIGKYLVLHHALSSILRIGDVSLVDLQDGRVKGVGEIKTSKTGNDKFTATLYAVSKEELPKSPSMPTSDFPREKMPDKQVAQLHRQLDRMSELVTGSQNRKLGGLQVNVESPERIFADLVLNATCSNPGAIAINESLVCVAIRQRRRSLHNATFRSEKAGSAMRFPPHISSTVCRILVPESKYNSITVSPFFYDSEGAPRSRAEATPLFWWPIALEAIRRIFFREVIVVTVFNPAPLIENLLVAGFEVKPGKRNDQFEVQRNTPERSISIHGIDHFIEMIKQSFYSADEVSKMITQCVSKIEATGISHGRVDINLKQMYA